MIAESTHITVGSPRTSYRPKTYIDTYKFEKKAWNMYCNVCALEMSSDNLIGLYSFYGVIATKVALN